MYIFVHLDVLYLMCVVYIHVCGACMWHFGTWTCYADVCCVCMLSVYVLYVWNTHAMCVCDVSMCMCIVPVCPSEAPCESWLLLPP